MSVLAIGTCDQDGALVVALLCDAVRGAVRAGSAGKCELVGGCEVGGGF